MDKLIIEVAVNETTTRANNPNVPLTPEELASDVAECVDAGASIVHFHPRDPLCPPDKLDIARLGDVSFYKEAIGLMKERCDVIPYPPTRTRLMPGTTVSPGCSRTSRPCGPIPR